MFSLVYNHLKIDSLGFHYCRKSLLYLQKEQILFHQHVSTVAQNGQIKHWRSRGFFISFAVIIGSPARLAREVEKRDFFAGFKSASSLIEATKCYKPDLRISVSIPIKAKMFNEQHELRGLFLIYFNLETIVRKNKLHCDFIDLVCCS